jgi:hypothetical protein
LGLGSAVVGFDVSFGGGVGIGVKSMHFFPQLST